MKFIRLIMEGSLIVDYIIQELYYYLYNTQHQR